MASILSSKRRTCAASIGRSSEGSSSSDAATMAARISSAPDAAIRVWRMASAAIARASGIACTARMPRPPRPVPLPPRPPRLPRPPRREPAPDAQHTWPWITVLMCSSRTDSCCLEHTSSGLSAKIRSPHRIQFCATTPSPLFSMPSSGLPPRAASPKIHSDRPCFNSAIFAKAYVRNQRACGRGEMGEKGAGKTSQTRRRAKGNLVNSLHHDIRVVVAYCTPPMCHVHFTSTSHPLAVHVFGCERCLP